jgi:hypothetical protein
VIAWTSTGCTKNHYIAPTFQTGAEQCKWLIHVVAVGRGRVLAGAVEYRVWALADP